MLRWEKRRATKTGRSLRAHDGKRCRPNRYNKYNKMTSSIPTFVINLDRRRDRRSETEQELTRVGWSADFVSAIEPKDAGNFPSTGARGCFLSHLAVLKKARAAALDRFIILEDDIHFVPDFLSYWRLATATLEQEPWSIFYPGHVLDNLEPGLSRLRPTRAVQCAHFMMINGSCLLQLIDGLETMLLRPPGHSLGSPMHVDGAYSTIRMQNPELITYAHSPSLGYQRPSRSDIGNPQWFDRIVALRPIVSFLRKRKARKLQMKFEVR